MRDLLVQSSTRCTVSMFSMRLGAERRASCRWLTLWHSPYLHQVGSIMVLGGDGRWFNKEACQIIIQLAAGNGVKKLYVGRNGYLCTPAASAVIRTRKAFGGFIMSASHNPGGPEEDWGIKFNYKNGEPAPESLTDKIYGFTKSVSVLKMAEIPHVDITKDGVSKFGDFEVEVIDPVADYLALFEVPSRAPDICISTIRPGVLRSASRVGRCQLSKLPTCPRARLRFCRQPA